MVTSAFAASFHYIALAIGLGSIFARGRALRRLRRDPRDPERLDSLFFADNLWGIAALLWIGTGLWRALGGFEKGWAWYSASPMFWLKMRLFGVVFLLELLPMITFIRWRIARSRGAYEFHVPGASLPRLQYINDAEVALTLAIPFVASLMARGTGLG